MPSLGCHVSIRRGYLECARNALRMGAGAFQFFPKNPRSLHIKHYNQADAIECAAFCHEQGLVSITHSPYPTNLAEQGPELAELTVRSLQNDLEITEACGAIGVVVHFGKSRATDPLEGYRAIISCLNRVLQDWPGKALLLLENQAGEGSLMGSTLHELVQIRSMVNQPEKIGFCFDTCHAYGSGLWKKGKWSELEQLGTELGYWQQVKAVHFNDSLYPSGSFKDRHAQVGSGLIGIAQMSQVIQSPKLSAKPFILETAAGSDGTHKAEIELMRKLSAP
ncbi:MAG: deoxyribonuclease IV [Gorillibacterium sp.]|nr:deoxyribonuclease IV [Gorillibacterium sp.]